MNITLAYQTLRAIDQCVRIDQGARFRQFQGQVLPHIKDAYNGKQEEGFRSHLGASLIGRECDRELWYSFRWATKSKFSGQMQRLFNRGHLEEGRFIALMLTMGVQIYQQDADGRQYRISEYGSHFGGSSDGVAIGIPDLGPGQACLSEYKTHNDKSFSKLAGSNWKKFYETILDPNLPRVQFEGEGVRLSKFEHFVQMQIYMRKMGLAVALYMAVNKNDDQIYAELITLDAGFADKYIERAGRIIALSVAPPQINKSPGWGGPCFFCDQKPVCKLKATPERNCRTCHYSEPNMETGKWYCTNMVCPGELSKKDQLQGCSHYEKNPGM